ncbi:MAG: cation:proton antiporter [Myxococcales bacterium]|nr:cation:proton antiporter [Myxococcales bacterium]
MVAAAIALYFLVRSGGKDLIAAASGPAEAGKHAKAGSLGQVFFAVALVIVFARLVGAAFERWLNQSAVMGEITAGLVLGPSALGAISHDTYARLFPPIASQLGLLANLGVVLFMFLVGLGLDLSVLRRSSHAVLAISHASIVAPFVLGATLALGLYPLYGYAGSGFTVFSLFLGVSMSVTAFPVLARILIDRGMENTPLGATALACAAVDDVTAWCLLALVSAVAVAQVGDAAWTLGLLVAYAAFMWVVVRPILRSLADREDRSQAPVSLMVLSIIFGALLLSAAATELIGVHALFGAFALGALIPHDGRLAMQLRAKLEDAVTVLLLPIFFAFTGMRTQIGLISGAQDWLLTGAIVLVATAGKFGGSFVAARFVGLGWREASALGILMNTRGLMELVVLNVGLDMGVLSPTLFTMLVLMAVLTTFATTPILGLITGRGGGVASGR